MLGFSFWKKEDMYLKEARDERDDSNNEEETIVRMRLGTSVLSVFEVTPTIVAYVELEASNSLNLASELIAQEAISK